MTLFSYGIMGAICFAAGLLSGMLLIFPYREKITRKRCDAQKKEVENSDTPLANRIRKAALENGGVELIKN